MPDYSLCGWHLRSDRSLPFIHAIDSSQLEPDIHVIHDAIPAITQPILFSSPFVTLYANEQALVHIAGTLSILVSAGRQITIDATAKTTPEEVMSFLLGPALGLICHQRHVLPLHGATIKIGNTAVTLVGNSGAGKSTSATALIKRGHQLLCDDISVVDTVNMEVHPSFPALKLWQDTADALAIETNELSKVRAGLQKFHYPADKSFNSTPTKLHSIIILSPRSHIDSASLSPLDKISALALLRPHIYRRTLAELTGVERTYIKQLGKLISHVPVMLINRPDDISHLDSVISLIESAVLS